MNDSLLQQLAGTDRNPMQEQEYRRELDKSGIPYTIDAQGKTIVEGFGAGGGSADGRGFFSPANILIQQSIAAYTKQLDEYNKKYNQYTSNNPFVFDEVLKEESAKVKERLDPYYTQTLGDYLQGVETQRRRSLQDERTLLSELQRNTDTYTGNERQQLEDAIDKSQQGFADAGVYDSGARLREEGRIKADSNERTDEFNYNQEQRANAYKLSTERGLEDSRFQEGLKRRDLATDQAYQVQAQAIPEAQSRQKLYEFQRQQFAGTPPGVNPINYQNSLYGLLG